MEVEVSEPKFVGRSILSGLQVYLFLLEALRVKWMQEKSAKHLASLGSSEPQLKSIPRRRSSL
jgi:hypothetical protein